jgi:hypothetical protein
MALRKETVQITVDIEGAQGVAQFKKLSAQSKTLTSDLNKLKKAGQENTEEYKKMQAELDKVNKEFAELGGAGATMGQLTGRARNLKREIMRLAPGTKRYIEATRELKSVNNRLKDMRDQTRGVAQGIDEMRVMGVKIPPMFSKMFAAFAAIEVIKGAKEVAIGLFNMGREAQIMDAKFKRVFGDARKIVNDFAKANARDMGLTIGEYQKAATAAGDLLIPMGFQRESAAQLSGQLINLSGALSNWTAGEKDAAEVSEILTKALLGEREQLKSLGISIREADVTARLAAKGQDKLTGSALEQAKALATLELITEKSTDAQKEFAEGGENLSKQANRIRETWQSVKEFFANLFIPVFATVLGWINAGIDGIISFGRRASASFSGFRAAAGAMVDNVKRFFQDLNLSATIMAKKLDLALSVKEETKNRLRADIAALELLRDASAQAGTTIGQAYKDAYLAALADTESASTPGATIVPIGGPSTPGDQSANERGIAAAEETFNRENLAEIQRIENDIKLAEIQRYSDQENQIKINAAKRLNAQLQQAQMRQTQFEQLMEEKKRQARELTTQAFGDSVRSLISLLGRDEAARKKNASILKALNVGLVTVDGIKEIAAIWKHAADLGPILGPIVGAARTAAAGIRTGLAISKLKGTGFFGGGYTGNVGFFNDNQGRKVVGAVHANEWVSPEWMTSHPQYAPIINSLEQVRKRGYVEGGFATDSTTPSPAIAAQVGQGGGDSFGRAIEVFERSSEAMVKAIKMKQFYITSGQVADAIDDEAVLDADSSF